MNIRCGIIDDEPLARNLLKKYIEDVPWLKLVMEDADGISAIKSLKQTKVDLLFLDIKMPGFTGIQFLKAVKDRPKVIITTAYRDFAVEGFEMEVTDYLLKPFSFERFMKGINKVLDKEAKLYHYINKKDLLIKTNGKLVSVPIDSITHIQSAKDYIKIFTPQKKYITYRTISGITNDLPENLFIRVHRSYTINLNYFSSIEDNQITLNNDLVIPCGRKYKSVFLSKLGEI